MSKITHTYRYEKLWTDEAIVSQVENDLSQYQAKSGRKLEVPIYPEEVAETLWEVSTKYPDHVFNEKGEEVLARFDPDEKIIEVNSSLKANEGQVSFTIAHEVGHISMHSFLSVIYCGLKNKGKSAGQIERQADKYAGMLLMPQFLITEQVKGLIGITSEVDLDLYSPKLMTIFKVSRQALEIRLSGLGYKLSNSKYEISNNKKIDKILSKIELERQMKQSRGRMV